MSRVVSPDATDELIAKVLRRLGTAPGLSPDLDGLRAVYSAWCRKVPFDNLRKMIALRAGSRAPLPGGCAGDFFEQWLTHGCGGTCWPTSNALFELLRRIGFDARRVAAAMRDLGGPTTPP